MFKNLKGSDKKTKVSRVKVVTAAGLSAALVLSTGAAGVRALAAYDYDSISSKVESFIQCYEGDPIAYLIDAPVQKADASADEATTEAQASIKVDEPKEELMAAASTEETEAKEQQAETVMVADAAVKAGEDKKEAEKESEDKSAPLTKEEKTSDDKSASEDKTKADEKTEDKTEEAAKTEEPAKEEASTEETQQEDNNIEETPVHYTSLEGKAVAAVGTYLNIRKSADSTSEIVGTLGSGAGCTVVEKSSGWTSIKSGNVEGYVRTEYLRFGDDAAAWLKENGSTEKAYVTTDSLNIRKDADKNSELLSTASRGESYVIVDRKSGWTGIRYSGDKKGYVSNSYIEPGFDLAQAQPVEKKAEETKEKETEKKEEASTEQSTESASDETQSATEEQKTVASSGQTGQDIANYAVQFEHNPYVYGGTSLTNGADCSGFVMSVYKNFGYSLSRTAAEQANDGTEVAVSTDTLEPGDLIFYINGGGSYIGHVALYIGNGQIIHAASSTQGIIIQNYNYHTPCKAVRIVNQ